MAPNGFNSPHRSRTCFLAALLWCSVAFPMAAREKDTTDYGVGLITNIPLPEAEVAPIVSDVAQNGIIRGTKEYEKDEYMRGAKAAQSCNLFSPWTDGGKIFYKVRKDAVDPRNFKDSNDTGTVAVRYVVQPGGEHNTVVRIDAVFVETFRHAIHRSNGAVESSEFKIIQDRLDAIELMKKQAADAEQERQQRLSKRNFGISDTKTEAALSVPSTPPEPGEIRPEHETLASGTPPGETLEEHVANLRHELQRMVKAPGAPLKSAPYHSANTLKTLPKGTEVLIVIRTTYWFGVETHDGQHGWIAREQLESLP